MKTSIVKPKPTATDSYVVQRGDNLTGIAARFGVTVNQLVKLNKIKNKNLITVGQVLKIGKKAKLDQINLKTRWYAYKTAIDALHMRNWSGLIPAGKYEITHYSSGVPHVRSLDGKHSGWLHPSVLE